MSAPSVSRVLLIGEIAKVERKTIGQGADARPLSEFTLDGFRIRISAWQQVASQVPDAGRVMVEGTISDRQYTVQNNGESEVRTTTEIRASSVMALDGQSAQQAAPAAPPTGAQLPQGGF